MKPYWKFLGVFLLLSLWAGSAQAEVFRYENKEGRTVFTDRLLKDSRYSLVWRSSVGHLRAASKNKKAKRNWRNKKKYVPIIKQIAGKARVSPELIHAVVQAESAYNSKAKSSAGAMGLMQLMPATAKRYGVSDIWDPAQNLEGGARYLRDLLDMFKNNLRLALAAYNAGEGAVKKYGNRIPPYRETRDYVRKVIGFYRTERNNRRS